LEFEDINAYGWATISIFGCPSSSRSLSKRWGFTCCIVLRTLRPQYYMN